MRIARTGTWKAESAPTIFTCYIFPVRGRLLEVGDGTNIEGNGDGGDDDDDDESNDEDEDDDNSGSSDHGGDGSGSSSRNHARDKKDDERFQRALIEAMASCKRTNDGDCSTSQLNRQQHATRKEASAAPARAAEGANGTTGAADADSVGSDATIPAFTPGQEQVVKFMWQRATTLADNAFAKVRARKPVRNILQYWWIHKRSLYTFLLASNEAGLNEIFTQFCFWLHLIY